MIVKTDMKIIENTNILLLIFITILPEKDLSKNYNMDIDNFKQKENLL